MVLRTAGLSTVLTNDIALFAVVPFTIALQSVVKNDVRRLVIFEALAANVGSLLTPIGNPQNLFLWRQWGNRFPSFTMEMLPLALALLALLLAFTAACFPGRTLDVHSGGATGRSEPPLFLLSLAGLAAFVVLIEFDLAAPGLLLALAAFAVFRPKVLLRADWLLIVLFILVFIDVRTLTAQAWVTQWVGSLGLENPLRLYAASIGLSQIISNVPAAILIAEFSQNWKVIAFAVNIAGNGLVVSSLANIIALRLGGGKSLWLAFHLYSLPFLAASALAGYLLLGSP
jgi:Na+/H+ antiporter NhaD/arsenite permease-like protein